MRDKITCWFHSFCGSFHLHSNRRIRPHFFHSLFWFHSKKAFYLTANHEESKQEGIENGKNCENLIFCQFHYLFLILTKNRQDTMILLFCNILPQIQRYLFVTTAIIESLKPTIFDKKGTQKNPQVCVLTTIEKL